jgi:uncharacterized protein (TIGR02145 family)
MKRIFLCMAVVLFSVKLQAQIFTYEYDKNGDRTLRYTDYECVSIDPALAGKTLDGYDFIYPNLVNADEYCWTFSDGGEELDYCTENTHFMLCKIPGIRPGANYQVAVTARTANEWKTACPESYTINTRHIPAVSCCLDGECTIWLNSADDVIECDRVPGASYKWKLTDQGGNEYEFETRYNTFSPGDFDFPVDRYQLCTKVYLSGMWGEYGPACELVPGDILTPLVIHCPGRFDNYDSYIELHNAQKDYPDKTFEYEFRVVDRNTAAEKTISETYGIDEPVRLYFEHRMLIYFFEPQHQYDIYATLYVDGEQGDETLICSPTVQFTQNLAIKKERFSSSSIEISWTNDNEPEWYTVRYKPLLSNEDYKRECPWQNNHVIENLQPDMEYEIKVVAEYMNPDFDYFVSDVYSTGDLFHISGNSKMLCGDISHEFTISDIDTERYNYWYEVPGTDMNHIPIESFPFRVDFPGYLITATLMVHAEDKVNGRHFAYSWELSECLDDCGITEYQGKYYGSVDIKGQCWMAENLDAGARVDFNDKLYTGQDEILKYCYDNNDNMCAEYGGLYTWEAAMKGSIGDAGNKNGIGTTQGICPSGWHIPSKHEFLSLWAPSDQDLAEGGSLMFNAKKAGHGMVNFCHNKESYPYKLDEIGFHALGQTGSFITSEPYSLLKESYFFNVGLDNENQKDNSVFWYKSDAEMFLASLRCVKDKPENSPVSDDPAHSLTVVIDNDFQGQGSTTRDITFTVTVTNPNATAVENIILKKIMSGGISISNGFGSDGKELAQFDLAPGASKTITCPGQVNNHCGQVEFGIEVVRADGLTPENYPQVFNIVDIGPCFTLINPDDDFLVDERAGNINVYDLVEMGNNIWFVENLNVDIHKICHKNQPGACLADGGLYSWDGIMEGAEPDFGGKDGIGNTRGICPEGYHIPTIYELEKLGDILFEENRSDGTAWVNYTDFDSSPSGTGWDNGTFYDDEYERSVHWSSSADESGNAWAYYNAIRWNCNGLAITSSGMVTEDKKRLLSLRCAKDKEVGLRLEAGMTDYNKILYTAYVEVNNPGAAQQEYDIDVSCTLPPELVFLESGDFMETDGILSAGFTIPITGNSSPHRILSFSVQISEDFRFGETIRNCINIEQVNGAEPEFPVSDCAETKTNDLSLFITDVEFEPPHGIKAGDNFLLEYTLNGNQQDFRSSSIDISYYLTENPDGTGGTLLGSSHIENPEFPVQIPQQGELELTVPESVVNDLWYLSFVVSGNTNLLYVPVPVGPGTEIPLTEPQDLFSMSENIQNMPNPGDTITLPGDSSLVWFNKTIDPFIAVVEDIKISNPGEFVLYTDAAPLTVDQGTYARFGYGLLNQSFHQFDVSVSYSLQNAEESFKLDRDFLKLFPEQDLRLDTKIVFIPENISGEYDLIIHAGSELNGEPVEAVCSIPVNIIPALGLVYTKQDATCSSCRDGFIHIERYAGGEHPYTFQWHDGASGDIRTNLAGAEYTVTATDNRGVVVTEKITIHSPSPADEQLKNFSIRASYTDAFATWEGGGESFFLRFRETGSPNWQYLSVSQHNTFISNLQQETAYEIEIATVVNNTMTDYSFHTIFYTLPLGFVSNGQTPVITGQEPVSTQENSPVTILPEHISVLDPDSDYPADFTFMLLAGENYSVSELVITPDSGFTGFLSAPLFVNDGTYNSNTAPLAVEVVPLPKPDLQIQGISLSLHDIISGTSVQAHFTLKNTGDTVSEPSYTDIWLSRDSLIDEGDIFLEVYYFDEIPAGQNLDAHTEINIPLAVDTGAWNMIFMADSKQQVRESDESDNFAIEPVTVLSRPDLVVSETQSESTEVIAGRRILATCLVKNSGKESAGPNRLGYYLSADTIYDISDLFLDDDYVGELKPKEDSPEGQNLDIPDSTSPGQWYILFLADKDSIIDEIYEHNNLSHLAITVLSPYPDLMVENATLTPAFAAAGGESEAFCTVLNSGYGRAGGTRLHYYISADDSLSADDIFLDDSYVRRLRHNSSSDESTTLSIPEDLPTGDYYILFVADGEEGIQEENENNNITALPITIQPHKPDLIVTNNSDEPLVTAHGDFEFLWCRVQNTGGDQAGSSRLGYYISEDTIPDSSDDLVGTDNVNPLNAGNSSFESLFFIVPESLPYGTSYLLFVADIDSLIDEVSETNNVTPLELYIAPPVPDLIVENADMDKTEVLPGEQIRLESYVTNIGGERAARSNLGFFLSKDAVIDQNDILLAESQVRRLPTGRSTRRRVNITLPEDTEPGLWHILFYADADSRVDEFDETNNIEAISFTVYDPRPDFIVNNLLVSPDYGLPGDRIWISCDVMNAGKGPADASFVSYFLSEDSIRDADDLLLDESFVGNLAGGDDSYEWTMTDIPPETEHGIKYIIAEADAGHTEAETDETNNTATAMLDVLAFMPDLIISDMEVTPALQKAGNNLYVQFTAENQGFLPSEPCKIEFYLSESETITPETPLLAEDSMTGLQPDEIVQGDKLIRLSTETDLGQKYLVAHVDAGLAVKEGKEQNNTNSFGIEIVSPKPDLIIADNSSFADTIEAGDFIYLSASVKNTGYGTSAQSSLSYVLSEQETITPNAARFTDDPVSTLSPGQTGTERQYVQIPEKIKPGTYFFIFTADVENQVDEASEVNNTVTTPVVISNKNDIPRILSHQTMTSPEDVSFDIQVDKLDIEDPDNDYPADFTLTIFGGANYTVNGETIIPATDFYGKLEVPVAVSDGQDTSLKFIMTPYIKNVNDIPVITGQKSLSTEEEKALYIKYSDIMVDDVDNSYPGQHSIRLLPGDNYDIQGVSVIPERDFYGTLSVPVVVNDRHDFSKPFDLVIRVTNVNDAPVITDQMPLTTDEEVPLALTLEDLVVEDVDNTYPGDFTMTLMPGENYTVTGSSIHPQKDFFGALHIPVFVNDGLANSDIFSLELQVKNVNDPPRIVSQHPLETGVGEQIGLTTDDFVITDIDNSFDELSLLVTAGEHYTFEGTTLIPVPYFSGVLSVPVLVSDGTDNSDIFDAEITVKTDNLFVWTGNQNNAWSDAQNWKFEGQDAQTPPADTNNVLVPPVDKPYPAVDGRFSVNNLTLYAGAELSVACGAVFITNGDIVVDTNAVFTVEDDSENNSGQLFTYGNFYSHGGIAIYERWLLKRANHYISSPVDEAANDLNLAQVPRAKGRWNEPENSWAAVTGDLTVKGRGYAYYYSQNVTANFVGNEFNLRNNENAFITHETEGYNLIGNPYPFSIDAYQLLKTNTSVLGGSNSITGRLSIWNEGSELTAYDESFYIIVNAAGSVSDKFKPFNGYIAPCQAFFVQAVDSTTGIMQFNKSMAELSQKANFYKSKSKMPEIQKVKLFVDNGINQYNEILLAFKEGSTYGYDMAYDAGKGGTGKLSVYSFIEDEKYAIQTQPKLIDSESRIIPVGVYTKNTGNILFDIKNIVDIDTSAVFYLEDKEKDTIVDLQKNDGYSVSLPAGRYDDRFQLIINYKAPPFVWVGDDSNLWSEPQNWEYKGSEPLSPPSDSNDVLVPFTHNHYPTVNGNFAVRNLTLEAGAELTVGCGALLTTHGDVTLDTNAVFTVEDNIENNSGEVFIHGIIESNGGTCIFERYLYNKAHHFISSPVDSAPQYDPGFAPRFNFYFDEEGQQWVNHTGEYIVAKGYDYYFRKDVQNYKFIGSLFNNNELYTINITNSKDSFNLVGNPFPFSINADDFISGNISKIGGTIIFWDETKGKISHYVDDNFIYYNYTNGSVTGGVTGRVFNGKIAPAQGFWVKCNHGPNVLFNKNMRSLSQQGTFFKSLRKNEATLNKLKLSVHEANRYYDEFIISFIEDATYNFDNLYDAKKMNGMNFGFYSLMNNKRYAIQTQPSVRENEQRIIQLGIAVIEPGNYTFSVKESLNMFDMHDVFLEDSELDSLVDLYDCSYTVRLTKGKYHDRFRLLINHTDHKSGDKLQQTMTNKIHPKPPEANIYAHKNKIYVYISDVPEKAYAEVYDIVGKKLIKKNITSDHTSLSIHHARGVYIVKIISGDTIIKTAKVHIE